MSYGNGLTMMKLPQWVALVILAALLACGEQTPTIDSV